MDTKGSSMHELRRQPLRDTVRSWQAVIHYPRVTGTVAILAFIFILARHFPQGKVPFDFSQGLHPVLDMAGSYITRGYPTYLNTLLGSTAGSKDWFESQDLNTMKEILCLVDPMSTSFIARIYRPLVVLPKSASRNMSLPQTIFQPSQVDSYKSTRLALSVLLLCSIAIFLVSNYITHPAQDEEDSSLRKPASVSSVCYLPHGHALDIYLLSASPGHYLASVGFDHEIRYWDLGSENISCPPTTFSELHGLWPAASIAIDDQGEWLAISSKRGDVGIWNINQQQSWRTIATGLDSHLVMCSFTPGYNRDVRSSAPPLLMVGANGLLIDAETGIAKVTAHQICANQIRSSHLSSNRPVPLRLISVTENDEIYSTVKRDGCWVSQLVQIQVPILQQPTRLRITTLPGVRMVGLAFELDTSQLYLIDFLSGQ